MLGTSSDAASFGSRFHGGSLEMRDGVDELARALDDDRRAPWVNS